MGIINIYALNNRFASTRIEIMIVQNTMQYGVYGAIIRIQDYLEENHESAQTDIYLDILQIEDNVLLSESWIRVNGISYTISDISLSSLAILRNRLYNESGNSYGTPK